MYTAEKFLSNIKTYTKCLGHGAFGIVLKGIDESNTPFAIKFLFPDLIDSTDREKLCREYQITKDLQHENIVQIMGEEEKKLTTADIDKIFKDLPYNERSSDLKAVYIERAKRFATIESMCIKMELCGSNLRNWLNENHKANELDIKIQQTRVVQGTIAGLKFLHSNKIIHRDLKPENIMFSRDIHRDDLLPVKIGDFGHSRLIHSEESQTGSLTSGVGTRSYMAPEVTSGEYDHQADLYSLGLIIWEVTQFVEEKNRRNLFDILVNDEAEYLVEDHPIMIGIKEIIIRLTKRKMADRTKSLVEINTDAWEEALVQNVNSTRCTPLREVITSNFNEKLSVKTIPEFQLALDKAIEGRAINLMDGEYPEVDVHHIVEHVRMEPLIDLFELATQLDIPAASLSPLKSENVNAREKLLSILQKWISLNGKKATVGHFINILYKLQLQDLAERLDRIYEDEMSKFGSLRIVNYQTRKGHKSQVQYSPNPIPNREVNPMGQGFHGHQQNSAFQQNYRTGQSETNAFYHSPAPLFSSPTWQQSSYPHNYQQRASPPVCIPSSLDNICSMFSNANIRINNTEKVSLYLHNLPEYGQDTAIVTNIISTTHTLPPAVIEELECKRIKKKEPSWYSGLTRWIPGGKKENDSPPLLKVKLQSNLDSKILAAHMQNHPLCKKFNYKVSESENPDLSMEEVTGGWDYSNASALPEMQYGFPSQFAQYP